MLHRSVVAPRSRQAGGLNVVLNKGCAMPSPAYKREIGRTHKTTAPTAPASQNHPTAKSANQ